MKIMIWLWSAVKVRRRGNRVWFFSSLRERRRGGDVCGWRKWLILQRWWFVCLLHKVDLLGNDQQNVEYPDSENLHTMRVGQILENVSIDERLWLNRNNTMMLLCCLHFRPCNDEKKSEKHWNVSKRMMWWLDKKHLTWICQDAKWAKSSWQS